MRMLPIRGKQILITSVAFAALLVSTHFVGQHASSPLLLAYWIIGAAVICLCLAAYIVGRRATNLTPAPGRVLCIVPVYNEPTAVLRRTVDALLAQTVPIDIVVIDDGSTTPVVPTVHHPRVRWWAQENTGKRGAQVTVLRRVAAEGHAFVMTVDSDSQPYPNACEELLRAMSDPRVEAATGMIYVSNHHDSWISMAADMDIGGSCVMMRASRSMLGALETTSGALALYRAGLLYDHLDAYEVECGTGDDRWLALRALRRGEVVGVAEAGVETEMPSTLAGTYRQRLRWARSWWWMLPYVFRYLRFKQLISPAFGLIQLIISPAIIVYAGYAAARMGMGASTSQATQYVVLYGATYLLVRYCVSALYLIGRPNVSRRQKLGLLVIGTPAAILLNLILLAPTRYWALVKLFDNRWQTRNVDPNTVAPAVDASIPG